MKKFLFMLTALMTLPLTNIVAQTTVSQSSTEVNDTLKNKEERHGFVCTINEIMPTYVGGTEALHDFINKNLKYPAGALQNKQEGRVIVAFCIETDGSLTDVHVIRSLSPELDAEAVRVVKLMPKWNPGSIDGKPSRVRYNIPIKFTLPHKNK